MTLENEESLTLVAEQELESRYVMPVFARKPVEFVSGHGMILVDSQGKEYLDFLSGIGVCSLGHCHPSLVCAIKNQAEKLMHVSNYYYIENRGEVAQELSQLLNGGALSNAAKRADGCTDGCTGVSTDGCTKASTDGRTDIPEEQAAQPWKTFFANSGAEANECAIKLARLYAKKRAQAKGQPQEEAPSLIITLVNSFHGRTLATLAATGQSKFQQGFEPIPEGFLPTPINDIGALNAIFNQFGTSICAVMLEVVQGESGVHLITQEFLKAVREKTASIGALMICDEVQCGMFRTGKPFAFQHFGIIPDIVTMAKGIAGGMPMGACSARGGIGSTFQAGDHGSTFGGSNLSVAAARVTIAEMSKPAFAENVVSTGKYLLQQLATLEDAQNVRGLGLMAAIDLPEPLSAPDIVSRALDAGLVINSTGPHTLRFLPPLICTSSDVDCFIDRLRICINDVKIA